MNFSFFAWFLLSNAIFLAERKIVRIFRPRSLTTLKLENDDAPVVGGRPGGFGLRLQQRTAVFKVTG